MPNELPKPVSDQDHYDVEKIRLLNQIAGGEETTGEALPTPNSRQDHYDEEIIRLLGQIAEGGGGGGVTLYDSTGQNTDGAMTQKAVTDALGGIQVLDASLEKYGSIASDITAAVGAFCLAAASSPGTFVCTTYNGGGSVNNTAMLGDISTAVGLTKRHVAVIKYVTAYCTVISWSANNATMRLFFEQTGFAFDITMNIKSNSFTICGAAAVIPTT